MKIGVYQHFKGGRYRVIGTARHSEDITQEFVVYKPLYDTHGAIPDLCVRPREMWNDEVSPGVPRFAYWQPTSPIRNWLTRIGRFLLEFAAKTLLVPTILLCIWELGNLADKAGRAMGTH